MLPIPPLVRRALAAAETQGFRGSCEAEVGRLLHVLAGAHGRTRVGEIGTGCGVGSAWIVSALEPGVRFVTVEVEETPAATARNLLAADQHARVVHGDWREVMPAEAPFDLLFYDGGGKQRPDVDGQRVVELLAPRGLVVVHDLTPGRPTAGDPIREFWCGHPRLASTEVTVSATSAAILAVRTH